MHGVLPPKRWGKFIILKSSNHWEEEILFITWGSSDYGNKKGGDLGQNKHCTISIYSSCSFFLYQQQFYKQRQAEICKKLARAKQHPEAELLMNMSKKQVCLYH